MSGYSIHLAKQELLNHMLQVGGRAAVHLHRPAQVIQAIFEVELNDTHARCSVELGGHTGEITLRRSDRANHLHLRDFIQDIANGRHESAAPADPAPDAGPTQSDQDLAMHNLSVGYTDAPCAPPEAAKHPSGVTSLEVAEWLPYNLGIAFAFVSRYRAYGHTPDLRSALFFLRREQVRQQGALPTVGPTALARRMAFSESFNLGSAMTNIATGNTGDSIDAIEQLLDAA